MPSASRSTTHHAPGPGRCNVSPSVPRRSRDSPDRAEPPPCSRAPPGYTLAFDTSTHELFLPLTTGGTVVMVPDDIRLDPEAFVRWLHRERISYWDTVPSLWASIVDDLRHRTDRLTLPHLRTLVLGGEALHGGTVEAWRALAPASVRIFNVYGVTEAAVTSTGYRLPPRMPAAPVPIGRPLRDCRVAVVDDRGEVCERGAVGELRIGGRTLARGYIDRPAETARRFVRDAATGERWYRTGDRVRITGDGELLFVGREDDQVKIRGFRVELGEVEAGLRADPRVEDAVVTLEVDGRGSARLAAFYTGQVDARTLREGLEARLPAHMMPHRLQAVSAFPLTVNDKVDTRALLALRAETTHRGGSARPTARGATIQARLAQIFAQVLERDTVGIDDDFFELGGDSLSGIRIQRACSDAGLRLRAVDLLRHPTIRSLAASLEASDPSTAPPNVERPRFPMPSPRLAATLPAAGEAVMPLLAAQRRMLADRGRGIALDTPQLIAQCAGTLDREAFRAAVAIVQARHPTLRLVFRHTPTGPVQVVLRAWPGEVEFHRSPPAGDDDAATPDAGWDTNARKYRVLSPCAAPAGPIPHVAAVRRAAAARLAAGFDPTAAPPWHIAVHQQSDAWFSIVWTMHHLLLDGWSTALYLDELMTVYGRLRSGTYRPLPRPRADLTDVVWWWHRRRPGPAERFWADHLAGAVPCRLPAEPSPPSAPDGRIDHRLDPTLDERLRRRARALRISPTAAVLAPYFRLLAEATGQTVVTIGVVTGGRDIPVPDVDHVLGNLIDVLPLCLDLAALPHPDDVARAVTRHLTAARQHPMDGPGRMAPPATAPDGEPWYDALFIAENYPATARARPEGMFQVVGVASQESNRWPLRLISVEDGPTHLLSFEYAAQHSSAERTDRLSRRFLTLLEDSVAGPATSVA